MGDDSGANASAPVSKNTEHRSEHADHNRPPETLVCMPRAEGCGRKENADGCPLSQGHELPLQVTSKDRFFANTGGNRERYPCCYFNASTRKHELHIATVRGEAQQPTHHPKQQQRDDPEASGYPNIPQHLAEGMPLISDNDEDRRATASHA